MEPRVALSQSPFSPGRFRWRMGVRPVDESRWLQVDGERDAFLDAKHPTDRRIAMPGSETAATELLEMVVDALAEHHGLRVGPDNSIHPIDAAGALVQEDLCVLETIDDEWVLTAASVHFPSGWEPDRKLGLSLDTIHAPVPRYTPDLGARPHRFLDRLRPGLIVDRAIWSLAPDRELQQPATTTVEPPSPSERDRIHVRVERQTLRRLPETDAIAFTIRVHRWSLTEIAADERFAADLLGALRALPDDVAAYKTSTARLGPAAVSALTELIE